MISCLWKVQLYCIPLNCLPCILSFLVDILLLSTICIRRLVVEAFFFHFYFQPFEYKSVHSFQMSPGRDGSDTDMEPTASQSQDCEPTPPLQRHGSKNNFYLPSSVSHGHSDGLSGGDAVNLMDSHSMSRTYVTRPSPHCRTR